MSIDDKLTSTSIPRHVNSRTWPAGSKSFIDTNENAGPILLLVVHLDGSFEECEEKLQGLMQSGKIVTDAGAGTIIKATLARDVNSAKISIMHEVTNWLWKRIPRIPK